MSSVILREIDKFRKLPRGKTDETAFNAGVCFHIQFTKVKTKLLSEE